MFLVWIIAPLGHYLKYFGSDIPLSPPIKVFCMYILFNNFSIAEQTQSFASDTDYISIWDIKDTYKVKILSAKNINVPENHKVTRLSV